MGARSKAPTCMRRSARSFGKSKKMKGLVRIHTFESSFVLRARGSTRRRTKGGRAAPSFNGAIRDVGRACFGSSPRSNATHAKCRPCASEIALRAAPLIGRLLMG
eukprot:2893249-Pleurochrysis_carterae.AAC.2